MKTSSLRKTNFPHSQHYSVAGSLLSRLGVLCDFSLPNNLTLGAVFVQFLVTQLCCWDRTDVASLCLRPHECSFPVSCRTQCHPVLALTILPTLLPRYSLGLRCRSGVVDGPAGAGNHMIAGSLHPWSAVVSWDALCWGASLMEWELPLSVGQGYMFRIPFRRMLVV